MIAAEEFTFPVISSNAALNLALLPPLWRISDPDQASTATAQRRQFASQVIKIDDAEEEAESESQEKMDLLWEDFNESSAGSESSSENHHSKFSNSNNKSGGDEFEDLDLEECANVRQLRLIRAKPRKMESLVKVVKKLFARTNQQKTNHN